MKLLSTPFHPRSLECYRYLWARIGIPHVRFYLLFSLTIWTQGHSQMHSHTNSTRRVTVCMVCVYVLKWLSDKDDPHRVMVLPKEQVAGQTYSSQIRTNVTRKDLFFFQKVAMY